MADLIESVLIESAETSAPLVATTRGISGQAFVKFTPLTGIREEDGPICYLLEVDNIKLLIDCGIHPQTLSLDHLLPLLDNPTLLKTIDAVLLTHASLAHCGALGAFWQRGLRCPVYATTPVHHLALLNGFEAAQGFRGGFQLPSWLDPKLYEQVLQEESFFKQVRYSQPIPLAGGLIMMALPAGHSPGATMWRIRKHGEDIVVALRFNHRKELTLDGAATDVFSRPSLLIVDATSSLMVGRPRSQRDSAFLDIIRNTQSHVLCVLNYERCLELLTLLTDNINELGGRPIYLVGHQSSNFLDTAKGMLEYMGVAMMRRFENTKENPFDFTSSEERPSQMVHCISHLNELDRIVHRQVIYVTATVERGLGLELLLRMHGDKYNSICILDGAISEDSLAYKLLNSSQVTIPIWEQEFLEGDDLRKWKLKEQQDQKQAEAEAAFAALQQRKAKISDELADFLDEQEVEGDEGDEEDLSLRAEALHEKEDQTDQADFVIESAEMMKEIFWSDYSPDWVLDMDKSLAMKLWLQDPEMASLSMLGGITPGCRFQAFPIYSSIGLAKGSNNGSGIMSTTRNLFSARLNHTAHGITLDPALYKVDDMETFTMRGALSVSSPILGSNWKKPYVSRAPVIVRDLRPHRWICKPMTLPLKCARKFVDFRGIIDGKSLKTVLAQISPRRVIVVGAGDIPSDFLANHLALSGTCQVVAPMRRLECVNVSQSQHLIPAVITDDLATATRIVPFNGYELGLLRFQAKLGPDNKIYLDANNDSLSVVKRKGGNILLIGDLRLANIRKQLAAKFPDLHSEFVQGDLVISTSSGTGQVPIMIVRKTDEDTVVLEALSNKSAAVYYHQIRSLLYSQLAIVK